MKKGKPGRKTEEEKRGIVLDKMRDPIWFMKNAFGVNVWHKQKEIIESVWNHQYTTVKASHASGKSFSAANIALTFLFTHPESIVITTAPTAKQVEDLIWKEIRTSLSKAKMELCYEITPSSANLTVVANGEKMSKRWYATGFSTNDATKFQGRHAENILFIFDEAAGILDEIFVGVSGMMTSANARLLLIGNPTSTSGGFFNSFKDPVYNKIHISAYDSPNFSKMDITEDDIYTGAWKEKHDMWIEVNGKEPYPFLATPKWVADHYAKWCKGGVKNALYLSKVEGEFVEQNDDSLIPVNWVEKAFDRWEEIDFDRYKGDVALGVDVAEFGDDNSCIAHRIKDAIREIKLYSELAIMDFAGIVEGVANRVKADVIKVDTIGIGTGVEGRLAEDGFSTKRVSVSKASKFIKEEELTHLKIHDKIVREMLADGENYHKLRSQMYWYLRMRLDPDKEINPYPIALPRNDMLIEELTGIKYSYTTKGAIALEPKKETKRRLGRSPDIADAVAIAFCPHEFIDDKATPVPKIRIL